jgi:hypothetical protein
VPLVTSALVIAATNAQASGVSPIMGALGETKPLIDARLRYEYVDQQGVGTSATYHPADAETLRLRLGFETGKAWSTSLLAEGEFLTPLRTDYRPDNAVAKKTNFPVVADPEAYELNRLQLVNTALPDTTLTLGRQRIILDDHRFVGNVGWRQNEQTYDAFRAVNKTVPNLIIDVTYLNRVNRIYGPDSPQGDYKGDTYLANVAYQTPFGKLTGFAYLLDFDPITRFAGLTAAQAGPLNPARSATQTYGARFAGERALSKIKLSYAASYATQSDWERNPLHFSNDYYLLEANATYRQFTFGAGVESLGGNGTVGFATPLATLHKFQGWADKFLTTPANGIDDTYGSFTYLMKGVGPLDTLSATAVYHEYQSERGHQDLGSEWNYQLQGKYQRLVGIIKYADYAASNRTPVAYRDTQKFWVELDFVW